MSDLDDIVATVERVRAEHFPQLSAELICGILKIESEQQDDRANAMRLIRPSCYLNSI